MATETDTRPRTLNENKWIQYLGRLLTKEESSLLERCKSEMYMNKLLSGLYSQASKKSLCVGALTEADGNCLFHSLVFHKLGNNATDLRRYISVLMFVFQKKENLFPNMKESLEELFNNINEIETVARNDGLECKYTYEVMCKDLSNEYTWSRLPTELIITLISFIFRVEIIIITNMNDYEQKINAYQGSDIGYLETIYLGLVDEFHYVPLIKITNPEDYKQLYYREAQLRFQMWTETVRYQRVLYETAD